MKFYYGDKLIRTSKTHVYTHAAININTGYCYGCSSSAQGAQANIDRMVSVRREIIGNARAAIKALESGKAGYSPREGRRSIYIKFTKDDTVEKYAKLAEDNEEGIDWCQKNLRVVELEQR